MRLINETEMQCECQIDNRMKINKSQQEIIKKVFINRKNELQDKGLENISNEESQEYQDILLLLGEIWMNETKTDEFK